MVSEGGGHLAVSRNPRYPSEIPDILANFRIGQ
jgi:hypothetical protein